MLNFAGKCGMLLGMLGNYEELHRYCVDTLMW